MSERLAWESAAVARVCRGFSNSHRKLLEAIASRRSFRQDRFGALNGHDEELPSERHAEGKFQNPDNTCCHSESRSKFLLSGRLVLSILEPFRFKQTTDGKRLGKPGQQHGHRRPGAETAPAGRVQAAAPDGRPSNCSFWNHTVRIWKMGTALPQRRKTRLCIDESFLATLAVPDILLP